MGVAISTVHPTFAEDRKECTKACYVPLRVEYPIRSDSRSQDMESFRRSTRVGVSFIRSVLAGVYWAGVCELQVEH